MDIGFWKDKRVLISGNTGFKGSWLNFWLDLMEANTLGYSLKPQRKSLFKSLRLDRNVETKFDDIRDEKKTKKIFEDFKPEIVFHLAAQPLVQRSFKEPRLTYETNIMGTINMIEAAIKSGSVKSFINVTSDKVYENNSWLWGYRENDPLNGSDPYSNSKSCADLIAQSYRKNFLGKNFKLANVRSGNVIGGGDWSEDRLVPDMIRSIIEEKTFTIRNPHATRPWQHVFEPLQGYLILAEKMHKKKVLGGDWNFGPDNSQNANVKEISQKFSRFWNSKVKISKTKDKFKEADFLRLDSTKSKEKLGWNSIWDLDKSLKETFLWYEMKLANKNIYKFSKEQLLRYSNQQN
tara:strand:+ start:2748 stop:3794 length:1047 start_codon:yes stop_codon:yes gene_type:complete